MVITQILSHGTANSILVGVVMLFDNAEGLQFYLPHPHHQAFVTKSGEIVEGKQINVI